MVLLLAFGGAAVVVALFLERQKTQSAELPEPAETVQSESQYEPFSGVAGDAEREGAPPASGTGLLARPVWTSAVEWARQAQERLDEAQEARDAGNHAGFQENGRAAKKLFEKALDSTESFYDRALEEVGETNGQVSSIRRKRSAWRKRQVALHKLIRI